MAIITFPKKQFEKEIGKLNERMQEKVAMFGTPIEKIDNTEVHLEIFPNRPDMLSYQGFKRSFLSFLEKKKGLKQYTLNSPKKEYRVNIDSSVKNIRPYTACAIVKGLKFDDEKIKEIVEIQEKLHLTIGRKRKKLAIGIYPLEKIKLPITYKALEPDKIKFTPLESPREMSGLEILQKHPTGKEYAPLLSGKAKFPIFVDSNKEILSMPPIINSKLTGKIDKRTRDVFVECSGDKLEILKKCLNIIVTALADMGGKIYQMKLNYGKTPDLKPEKMKISLENTNKLLGLNLTEKQLKQYLEKMGHNYNNEQVEIPSWRVDVLHEVDLIEDVAIGYGYENFIPEIPEISTIGNENPKETLNRKISQILAGLEMQEVSNFHLTTKESQFKKMGISEKQEKAIIEVENSKTDYNILRKNLRHYLLKNFAENVDSEYPQKIFEIGKVFDLNEKTGKITEIERLAIAITPGNYTKVKQILEYLSKSIGIEFKFEEPDKKKTILIEGRVAQIKFNKETIGYMGELHPKIIKNWKLKMPVALLEINLKEIYKKLI
jgi:phenylalanyl-tRNA synthetase beta chain